jgi:polysaccharide export outer membrane protein
MTESADGTTVAAFPAGAADMAPTDVAEKRSVAECGEPARRPQPQTMVAVAGWLPLPPPEALGSTVPAAPAPANAEWRPGSSKGETRGKTVIASNWRPMERETVAPAQATAAQPGLSPLVTAELPGTPTAGIVPPVLTAPQTPAGKPDDKKAEEKQPEQMPAPTLMPGPETAPLAPTVPAPVLGLPVASGPGGPAPRELCKVSLPPYVIEPPDVLLIQSTQSLKDQMLQGAHLVRPDGSVSLGIYGSVHVGGMTIEQAKVAIARQMVQRVKDFTTENLDVDVIAYNSKFYYVITDGGGYGEQVYRLPIYGSETVLDAIGQIGGLPPVASKRHIWLARRSPGHAISQLPVDWIAISQGGSTTTNYQVLPGDRIYVRAEKLIKIDSGVAKVLSPIERILGAVLLGSSTVNSIKNGGRNGSSSP